MFERSEISQAFLKRSLGQIKITDARGERLFGALLALGMNRFERVAVGSSQKNPFSDRGNAQLLRNNSCVNFS